MQNLNGVQAIVIGGNRGLGLGVVEALVARGTRVTVVGRDATLLDQIKRKLDVATHRGDATDRLLARQLLRELAPAIVVLNAGATPHMAPIHEQTWESFSATWENDVKAGLHWIQEAIQLPLARGSRILVGSSGAAVGGSPLSGGYAGAKRMLWFLAAYANGVSADQGLGLRFQALLPLQMADTQLGRAAAAAYAARKKVSVEDFFAGFGQQLTPQLYGEYVAALLTDPQYENGTAFGIRAGVGIKLLDAPSQ